MSDNSNNIIKLAEWVGWKRKPHYHPSTGNMFRWYSPDGEYVPTRPNIICVGAKVPPSFNPYKSDADCMAVRKHLNESGWWIIINIHNDESAHITIGKGMGDPLHDWNGDDYKQGVCELALKVCGDE